MVEIQDTLVSLDIFEERFCCDLSKCHGECCIEGDAGAPVLEKEIEYLEEASEVVWDDLDPKAQEVIAGQGVVYLDHDGEFVTSIVNDKDCVFTCYNTLDGDDSKTPCCFCAIDKAYREGRCRFQKPISCYLYPIRLSKVGGLTALNYHRWDVCKDAVKLGRELDIPLYKFLKEPLIRAFGQEWWDECDTVAGELKKAGYIK